MKLPEKQALQEHINDVVDDIKEAQELEQELESEWNYDDYDEGYDDPPEIVDYDEWSIEDERLAWTDGWNVDREDGQLMSHTGGQAFPHVFEQAMAGDRLALKALKIVMKHDYGIYAEYRPAIEALDKAYEGR